MVSLIIYQLGSFFGGQGSPLGAAVAAALVAVLVWLLVRPYRESDTLRADLGKPAKRKAS